jgi:hypothetical protein
MCVYAYISLYVLGAHCNCWPRTRGDVAMELAHVLGAALPAWVGIHFSGIQKKTGKWIPWYLYWTKSRYTDFGEFLQSLAPSIPWYIYLHFLIFTCIQSWYTSFTCIKNMIYWLSRIFFFGIFTCTTSQHVLTFKNLCRHWCLFCQAFQPTVWRGSEQAPSILKIQCPGIFTLHIYK